MSVKAELETLIPDEHFITEDVVVDGETRPPLAQRDTRRVILYIQRKTIGPFINRQDNEGDTIRARIEGIDHVRVPARKWKSIEKLRAIQLCRAYDVIPSGYLYNEVNDSDLLANPASVVFGDSAAASGDVAGIPSLAIYEQGVSVQSVSDATERLTHNALSEVGTMWNVGKEKGFRQSLFDTLYVREGVTFLQSITLEAPTQGTLALVLMALDATRYGAGKQVLGPNIKNEIVGILATRNEPPVTAYTVIAGLGKELDVNSALKAFEKAAGSWGGHWVDGTKAEAFRGSLRSDASGRAEIMRDLSEAAKSYHQFVYGEKKKASRTQSKGSAPVAAQVTKTNTQ